jgi:hypothetical protein
MGVRVKDNSQFKEMYVKALDSMPVGAEIDFDGDSADIPDGWKLVGNNYSTNEIKTGKTWKDGKPIYRITFYQSSYTQATNFNISISALNIDKLVLPPYGMTYDGTQQIPIPFANQSNEVNYAFRNGNNLACYLMYGTSADITLEYTKTTD